MKVILLFCNPWLNDSRFRFLQYLHVETHRGASCALFFVNAIIRMAEIDEVSYLTQKG